MANMLETGNERRRRPGFYQTKKLKVRIDMTPMVDLGFLLIGFFVMTTQLNKPSVVKLNMPAPGPPMTLATSDALTILLDDMDHVYYYQGDWKDAVGKDEIYQTNFSEMTGLGKVIRDKQKWLDANNKKEGRSGLMLLIKPGKEASYQHVVNALDETTINVVKKYAILKLEPEESAWLENRHR